MHIAHDAAIPHSSEPTLCEQGTQARLLIDGADRQNASTHLLYAAAVAERKETAPEMLASLLRRTTQNTGRSSFASFMRHMRTSVLCGSPSGTCVMDAVVSSRC